MAAAHPDGGMPVPGRRAAANVSPSGPPQREADTSKRSTKPDKRRGRGRPAVDPRKYPATIAGMNAASAASSAAIRNDPDLGVRLSAAWAAEQELQRQLRDEEPAHVAQVAANRVYRERLAAAGIVYSQEYAAKDRSRIRAYGIDKAIYLDAGNVAADEIRAALAAILEGPREKIRSAVAALVDALARGQFQPLGGEDVPLPHLPSGSDEADEAARKRLLGAWRMRLLEREPGKSLLRIVEKAIPPKPGPGCAALGCDHDHDSREPFVGGLWDALGDGYQPPS